MLLVLLDAPIDRVGEEEEGQDYDGQDFEDFRRILVKSEGPKEDAMYYKKYSLNIEVYLIRNFYFLIACINYF